MKSQSENTHQAGERTQSQDWCVVYRMGGIANFKWHRSLAMSREAAVSAKEACERGGRKAMVVSYSQSLSIGLPSTFE